MINFRYHLVSLTAVFLALAIGLVLGTAALNGPASDFLQDQVSSLREQNDTIRKSLEQLQSQLDQEEEFAKQIAPTALAGKLTDKPVLLLTVAGADEKDVQGAMEMLALTGAKVTGQLDLTDNFINPEKRDELLDLVKQLLPDHVGNLPNNVNGVETASALLGAVLMAGGPEVSPEEQKMVLSGFTTGQMLLGKDTFNGTRAAAVLIIAPRPYTDSQATLRNGYVATIAAQFDKYGSALLAMPVAGGAVTIVRDDPALNLSLSTVDNISTPQGQVAACLGLASDLAGKPGDWGSGAGAESTVPVPQA
ncbi:hypothetical protein Afil01_41260 [Actinorhabdospora filicis]|uniref:Copper transport outer membrane protein MctB n=1 Tax=Actinorhabdospora filicis TaxID=1785913 RepID=A0A9W6SLU5_9ACTN|nr:copper transporter [Actinorhabdospora filicis]GLZ79319.1 hypothetical protein Afil01_41260 [Actinorhabdospora filicis]